MASSTVDMRAISALGARRLTTDSRAVRPGDTFLAYPGELRDGRDYIAQAIASGAAAVLWDADSYAWNPRWRVPNLGIPYLRREAGVIANVVYGKPGAKLGKTTGWIHRATLKAKGVRMVSGVEYLAITRVTQSELAQCFCVDTPNGAQPSRQLRRQLRIKPERRHGALKLRQAASRTMSLRCAA